MTTQKRIRPFDLVINLLLGALALITLYPFYNVLILSFSNITAISKHTPYMWFWAWDLEGYRTIVNDPYFFSSLGNTLFVTVVGTTVNMLLSVAGAYVLSKKRLPGRGFLLTLVVIPMLFSGGLVARYMVNTQIYHLKNTYWAMILPGACSTFYVVVMRTFFQTTVPDSIIESGKIDGASQLRIFTQLVLPISLPVIATIGLFLTFNYWNAWYGAMLYIDSNHRDLYPLQYVLISIEKNISFMARNEDFFREDSMRNLPSETMRMAIVMVVVIPIACSYPFFQRYFVGGLTIGAVKG